MVDIAYQKKCRADVFVCNDCNTNQFALIAHDGEFFEEGEVVCLVCNESFGTVLQVTFNPPD